VVIFSFRLLFVLFDDFRRPDPRLIGVFAEFPQRPALAQQIPALIELDLDRFQPPLVGVGEGFLTVQLMLFPHELLDVLPHGLIDILVRHF